MGIAQGLPGDFPVNSQQRPGDFLANPRENTKAIPMILFGNSWGNLKANPLLLYTWLGCPTRAWTRPHETFQKFPKGVPQELPKTLPRSLHDSCHGSPGQVLKNALRAPGHRSWPRFPSILQDMPMSPGRCSGIAQGLPGGFPMNSRQRPGNPR